MKFVEVNKDEMKKRNVISDFLDEFLNSGIEVAKVNNEGSYKTNTIMCAAIRKEVNKNYADKITVKMHGGEVYLYRLNLNN